MSVARRSRFLLVVQIMAVFPSLAAAQSVPSPFRFVENGKGVGPYLGYVSFSKGRFGLGPSSGLVTGARWGVRLGAPLSAAFVGGLVTGDRDVIDPAQVSDDRAIGEADFQMVMADVRFTFTFTGDRTWHSLAPFLTLGAGLTVDAGGTEQADLALAPEDRFDLGNSFMATLGAGTSYHLNQKWSLRSEFLLSLFQIDTPDGFKDPSRGFERVENSEWVSGRVLTLSLLWHY